MVKGEFVDYFKLLFTEEELIGVMKYTRMRINFLKMYKQGWEGTRSLTFEEFADILLSELENDNDSAGAAFKIQVEGKDNEEC